MQKNKKKKLNSGACAAFLVNNNPNSFAKVDFGNMHYNLPPWSISILPDCKNTIYNTARVGAQSALMKMTPANRGFSWQSYNDETASYEDNTFTVVGLLEQINTTRDVSDYLWYMTDVKIDPREGFLRSGKWPWLTASSAGPAMHVFVNAQLAGEVSTILQEQTLSQSDIDQRQAYYEAMGGEKKRRVYGLGSQAISYKHIINT